MFEEFIGKDVKCCYDDNGKFKIAKGILRAEDDTHLKITGDLGTIIIAKESVKKLGLRKVGE